MGGGGGHWYKKDVSSLTFAYFIKIPGSKNQSKNFTKIVRVDLSLILGQLFTNFKLLN